MTSALHLHPLPSTFSDSIALSASFAEEAIRSVQFNSGWYQCARKSPFFMRFTPSHMFPQPCHLNGSNVRLTDDGPLSSFQGRSSSASSFHASLLQAIGGVMCLTLCPQVVSQASQHFRSSEKQATCESCFARQSVCSVVSLHSGMSRAVHPQEFPKVDVDHRHIPVWPSKRPSTHDSDYDLYRSPQHDKPTELTLLLLFFKGKFQACLNTPRDKTKRVPVMKFLWVAVTELSR